MLVLGIRGKYVRDLEKELLEKNELLRPGFVRVSFPYFLRSDEVEYVLRAIEQVSKHAYRLLPLYRFNHKTGEILHRKRFTKFSERLWLSDIGVEKKKMTKIECDNSYDELLSQAMSIYQSVTEKDLKQVPSHSMVLGEQAEHLRWFVWPDEISLIEAEEKDDSNVTTSTCKMLRPELYLKKEDEENLSNSEMKGSAVLQSLNEKFPRRTADSAPKLSSGELTLSEPRALKKSVVFVDSSSSSSSTSSKPAAKTTKKGKKMKNPKKIPKKISSAVGRAIIEWDMIREGDHLLVGLSGGKDSLTLLNVLLAMQKKAPVKFKISAATVDPKHDSFRPEPLKKYVKSLGVDYYFLSEPIFDRAKTSLEGNSICSYCARMKRGLLYSCCRKNGCNVLVLGQHLDDLAESFVMSAFNNGLIRTMSAHYTINEGDLRVIRPLVYVRESEMRKYSIQANLPVINENCPACFEAPKERHRVKKLLEREASLNPDLFSKLRTALTPLMSAEVCRSLREAGHVRRHNAKRAVRVKKMREKGALSEKK